MEALSSIISLLAISKLLISSLIGAILVTATRQRFIRSRIGFKETNPVFEDPDYPPWPV